MGASPREALAAYAAEHREVSRWCVAYSGGRDSHVLLHLAAGLLGGAALRAVHVDHGLRPESAACAEHCRGVARDLGVAIEVRTVRVEPGGEGPEAAARSARYAAFADALEPGEHLLLAQHARDQAETFLLQALRGSGPDGLASMPRKRAFGRGTMARPLISCLPEAIARHAEVEGLHWIEDPSNADLALDRNYLRREVLPLLDARWPAAVRTLSRAAHRCGAASQTLLGVAGEDLERVRLRGAEELSVSELRGLPRERAYNALRLRVRQAGLRMPRLQDLARVLDELVQARDDSAGIVDVRDYQFRRHGDRLYVLGPQAEGAPYELLWHAPFEDLAVPGALVWTGEGFELRPCRRLQPGEPLGVAQQQPALRRGHRPGGQPVEQADAQVLLQRRDVRGHRRLAQVQHARGLHEAAGGGDGPERGEVDRVHGHHVR